jgi:hypothetical protein
MWRHSRWLGRRGFGGGGAGWRSMALARVREAAWDRCTALGGGGWTRRSLGWADDGEAPSLEEADGDGIGSL